MTLDNYNQVLYWLQTILEENLEKENILGYKSILGDWEEDKRDMDIPIREFTENPRIQLCITNEGTDKLVTIRKKDIPRDADAAFDCLRQWLSSIFGPSNATEEELFGIIKYDQSYEIRTSKISDEELKEIIEMHIPSGFILKDINAPLSFECTLEGEANIGFHTYLIKWQHQYSIAIRYSAGQSPCCNPEWERKLCHICRNIAIAISNR